MPKKIAHHVPSKKFTNFRIVVGMIRMGPESDQHKMFLGMSPGALTEARLYYQAFH
jgi:hypothetical protein